MPRGQPFKRAKQLGLAVRSPRRKRPWIGHGPSTPLLRIAALDCLQTSRCSVTEVMHPKNTMAALSRLPERSTILSLPRAWGSRKRRESFWGEGTPPRTRRAVSGLTLDGSSCAGGYEQEDSEDELGWTRCRSREVQVQEKGLMVFCIENMWKREGRGRGEERLLLKVWRESA